MVLLDVQPLVYAGIGSRRAPPEMLGKLTIIAEHLYELDYVLRSGGAVGCDQAFEKGAGDRKEIFRSSPRPSVAAYELAARFHPAWHLCSSAAKALHARNGYQVLGRDLDSPVRFVLCWTPDGCEDGRKTTRETGGTGQALRIATAFGIPIFNFQRSTAFTRFAAMLEG